MIMTADQTTYAFKGAYFWPVGDQGAFTGALKISQFWEGLENDIDAGYTRHYDGLTFIFKGSRFLFDFTCYLLLIRRRVHSGFQSSAESKSGNSFARFWFYFCLRLAEQSNW